MLSVVCWNMNSLLGGQWFNNLTTLNHLAEPSQGTGPLTPSRTIHLGLLFWYAGLSIPICRSFGRVWMKPSESTRPRKTWKEACPLAPNWKSSTCHEWCQPKQLPRWEVRASLEGKSRNTLKGTLKTPKGYRALHYFMTFSLDFPLLLNYRSTFPVNFNWLGTNGGCYLCRTGESTASHRFGLEVPPGIIIRILATTLKF